MSRYLLPVALLLAAAVGRVEAADPPRTGELVEVTGSHLKRVESEGAVPLLVLPRSPASATARP